MGAGEIDLVKPYEVHAEQTIGERTVAVIIRSQKAGTFNQGRYDTDTHVYFESLGPRQTPVEMLPAKYVASLREAVEGPRVVVKDLFDDPGAHGTRIPKRGECSELRRRVRVAVVRAHD